MPIKKIGVKKYIWKMNRAQKEHHVGALGMNARNPFHKKWRKVAADLPKSNCACETNADTKHLVQEVFKDATPFKSLGICQACVDINGKCVRDYKIRIRSGMLQTNQQMKNPHDPTKRHNSYNYNYKQYLQRRCKTIHQNSFNFTPSDPENHLPHTFRGNCVCSKTSTTNNACVCPMVTYKPNNKKFSQQGAVSSGARLVRLKYDAITKSGKQRAEPYRAGAATPSNILKINTCQERVLGAGKRIFRSGGPRRPPRCVIPPCAAVHPKTGIPFSQKPNPNKCMRTCRPKTGILACPVFKKTTC